MKEEEEDDSEEDEEIEMEKEMRRPRRRRRAPPRALPQQPIFVNNPVVVEMREESYCGLISWLIAIFTGCWCIALCPVDKRMVQYRGAGRIVKSRPPSSSSPQRHPLLWLVHLVLFIFCCWMIWMVPLEDFFKSILQ